MAGYDQKSEIADVSWEFIVPPIVQIAKGFQYNAKHGAYHVPTAITEVLGMPTRKDTQFIIPLALTLTFNHTLATKYLIQSTSQLCASTLVGFSGTSSHSD